MWYIHIIEDYTIIKRNKPFETHNLDDSQKHYAEWKKKTQRLHIVWLHLCDIRVTKLEYDRAQISCCQELGWEQNVTEIDSTKELPEVMELFCTLILAVVTLIHIHVSKSTQLYTFPQKSYTPYDKEKGNRSSSFLSVLISVFLIYSQ